MKIDRNSMVATNSILEVKENFLDKLFTDYNCNEERKRNIQFFRENPMFSPRINYTFNSGSTLLGYCMEFIPGCITFKDAVGDESFSYDDKVNAINGVFSKLKMLHKCDILVGDMHAQNIMFNAQDGYIVDLDEVRFKDEDKHIFDEVYQIQLNNSSFLEEDSVYTDNVKATVCALSLLYGVDFEDLIHHKVLRISDLKHAISVVISDADFRTDVFRVLDLKDSVVYFDEILIAQEKKVKI